jgi:sensor histidine kinase YesM
MASDISSPPPSAVRAFAARAWRDLRVSLLIGAGIAVFLTLLFRQHFGITLVYSCSIALGCSLSIDALRWLASAWVHRGERAHGQDAAAHWPGWGWMVPCLVLGTLIGYTLGAELGNALVGGRQMRVFGGNASVAVALLLFSLVPGVTATYYFRAKAQLRSAEALAEMARRQAAETQLKLLESQLEPHMLFNTLANLRALIAVDPERAQAMLDRLIDFLRATLGGSRAAQHPLSAEFARLADYLALMKVRMGDRLRIELDLPPALAGTPVPPLLLQPLVENAIKHGLEPQRGGGLVRVQARAEAGELVITVADSGVGLRATARGNDGDGGGGGGFGVTQVRERLATLHGPRASLTLAPGAEGGAVATLRCPLDTPDASSP